MRGAEALLAHGSVAFLLLHLRIAGASRTFLLQSGRRVACGAHTSSVLSMLEMGHGPFHDFDTSTLQLLQGILCPSLSSIYLTLMVARMAVIVATWPRRHDECPYNPYSKNQAALLASSLVVGGVGGVCLHPKMCDMADRRMLLNC